MRIGDNEGDITVLDRMVSVNMMSISTNSNNIERNMSSINDAFAANSAFI